MISVLRYGHRLERDKRTTTHIGLVARAFGADKIIVTNTPDRTTEKTLKDIVARWGGSFEFRFEKDWKKVVIDFKKAGAVLVHLTMYGLPVQDKLDEIRVKTIGKDLLIFLGAEKVPAEVYELADYNIAVGSQPHSEIAALAVFLDRFFQGDELETKFSNAKMRIVPQPSGKKMIE
ncbi:MAG: tRNA (cytidine(56)-2'-O)-methyltransferase [Candidatus Altiarchaeota archaeon]|nr:tRNA (cytidine(56)-2'-O)-methyltransferase [Candidatus Altiarchaeota archaeon]